MGIHNKKSSLRSEDNSEIIINESGCNPRTKVCGFVFFMVIIVVAAFLVKCRYNVPNSPPIKSVNLLDKISCSLKENTSNITDIITSKLCEINSTNTSTTILNIIRDISHDIKANNYNNNINPEYNKPLNIFTLNLITSDNNNIAYMILYNISQTVLNVYQIVYQDHTKNSTTVINKYNIDADIIQRRLVQSSEILGGLLDANIDVACNTKDFILINTITNEGTHGVIKIYKNTNNEAFALKTFTRTHKTKTENIGPNIPRTNPTDKEQYSRAYERELSVYIKVWELGLPIDTRVPSLYCYSNDNKAILITGIFGSNLLQALIELNNKKICKTDKNECEIILIELITGIKTNMYKLHNIGAALLDIKLENTMIPFDGNIYHWNEPWTIDLDSVYIYNNDHIIHDYSENELSPLYSGGYAYDILLRNARRLVSLPGVSTRNTGHFGLPGVPLRSQGEKSASTALSDLEYAKAVDNMALLKIAFVFIYAADITLTGINAEVTRDIVTNVNPIYNAQEPNGYMFDKYIKKFFNKYGAIWNDELGLMLKEIYEKYPKNIIRG